MRITFLGTGTSAGVPMIGCRCSVCTSDDPRDKRLRSSILVETDELTVAVDIGPDFRAQMLRENVMDIDAVLITHGHRDHIAGLDEVRAFNFLHKKDIPIYADPLAERQLKQMFDYVFVPQKYPGVPKIELHQIDSQPFTVKEKLEVTPIKVWHYKMPVTCFRFGDFTYITDANRIEEEEKEKIKGSKHLVINALRRKEHISHFTVDEALALIEELQPGQAYLTHISHQLGRYEEEQQTMPEGVMLAYDGLKIDV